MVVAASCTEASEPARPSASRIRPFPSILSPAPTPASIASHGLTECPIGIGILRSGNEIPSSELVRTMDGHVPRWLPKGFGLMLAWTYGRGSGGWGMWTDTRCREVQVAYSQLRTATHTAGPLVGAWTVTENSKGCGNAVLGPGRCLRYEANVSGGAVRFWSMGLNRRLGDRIVLSIPL